MHTKGFYCLIILCLAFQLPGCTAQQNIESTGTVVSPTKLPNTVTITGWFTTVWNDEPHYSITDDQGQTTRLLLNEELTKPFGGPLELDRKRVTIVGEMTSDSPRTVRVLSIQFANTD